MKRPAKQNERKTAPRKAAEAAGTAAKKVAGKIAHTAVEVERQAVAGAKRTVGKPAAAKPGARNAAATAEMVRTPAPEVREANLLGSLYARRYAPLPEGGRRRSPRR